MSTKITRRGLLNKSYNMVFTSKIFVSLLFTKTHLVIAFECITATRYRERAVQSDFSSPKTKKTWTKSKHELRQFLSLPPSCRVFSTVPIKELDGNFV